MSATVETPEELRTKLETFEQQKCQVDVLLQKDPINRQFLKLRNDLQHVMALTRDLLKVSEEAERKNNDAEAAALSSSAQNSAPRPSTAYGEGGVNNINLEKDLECLGDEEEAFALGSRVEVLKRDKWYPAVIEAVLDEGQNFQVVFIGFTDTESKANATLLTMRQLKPPKGGLTKSQAVIGTHCLGLWVEDGQWYDCVIEEETQHGYSVVFSDYNNEDELPLEYLKEVRRVLVARNSCGSRVNTVELFLIYRMRGNNAYRVVCVVLLPLGRRKDTSSLNCDGAGVIFHKIFGPTHHLLNMYRNNVCPPLPLLVGWRR